MKALSVIAADGEKVAGCSHPVKQPWRGGWVCMGCGALIPHSHSFKAA